MMMWKIVGGSEASVLYIYIDYYYYYCTYKSMRLSILNDMASMSLLNIQIIQSILPNPNLYLRL